MNPAREESLPRRGLAEPRVVAVVVNFRTPDDAIRCVRSLQQLRYGNLGVLLVDNDSKDGSIERFRAELSGVGVIAAGRNGGYTAGNNLGIRAAIDEEADYVLVLNPDTVVLDHGFLRELAAYMEAHSTVGAVGPRVHLQAKGSVQNTVLRFPWVWRRIADWIRTRRGVPRRREPDRPAEAEALNGVCVLFRTACLKDVGLFDERTFAYIEDIDWGYRARRKGWRKVYLPVDGVLHLQRTGGYERGGRVDYLLKRNTLYFLMKSGRWFQAAFYTTSILALAAGMWASERTARGGARATSAARWMRAILRAFLGLWTARWDRVMGHPRL